MPLEEFLAHTDIVDWYNESVHELAAGLSNRESQLHTVKECFEWVRDEVSHSFDSRSDQITLRASEVLKYRTGICFAKSNLLAALLRANQIPAAFGYQRLATDDSGKGFCLHGFNFVWIENHGWHPLDARGNRGDIKTTFLPPLKSLAFPTNNPGERTISQIFAEPLPQVTAVLRRASSVAELEAQLPDWDDELD